MSHELEEQIEDFKSCRIKALEKENQRLNELLNDAVVLLNEAKEILTHFGESEVELIKKKINDENI